ncbi:MAG TPA: hypothetical protein ENK46_12285 [Flavobacteriia bacterium]|nr:hypothetical protein [Flavobacteriia bacterium]
MDIKEINPNLQSNENPEKPNNANPRIQRVLSMLLDHVVMTIVIVPLGLLIFGLIYQFEESLNQIIGIGLVFFPMFIYLNKDFFRAKSLAKRFIGYQIVDIKTKEPASELQCFIRNLTLPVWPLEVIVGLINPERRMGDFIANTKVITSKKEALKSIWVDSKNIRLKPNFIGILILGAVYFYGLSLLLFEMQ